MTGSRRGAALLLAAAMMAGLCACSGSGSPAATSTAAAAGEPGPTAQTGEASREHIERTLDLSNNADQQWSYDEAADAWVMAAVPAVAYPELPEYQGVSVCVPGAYVLGIDTDGDGRADGTGGTVRGSLVIDGEASITSTNGQVYTAATAPVIFNTGAAGYGSMTSAPASTVHAAEGYINVSCGNRGKQNTAVDGEGNTYYTGDAPCCLADQKAAARFVKYNILLGNLPGDAERFVSTGGSDGGAHAVMLAATGNHPDYYDYQIEAGAVGVYRSGDGSYCTAVTVEGREQEISDGVWGCIAYSAITSLYDADMALAFEYTLDSGYDFKNEFQKQLAACLSQRYMEYINEQQLTVEESVVGYDLDGDGALSSRVALTIRYDPQTHPETGGYYGSYLDLYLAQFIGNLQQYVDRLDYAEDWTWFDGSGAALSDGEVAAMTAEEKTEAFIAGHYAKASDDRGMGGGMPGGMGAAPGQSGGNIASLTGDSGTEEAGLPGEGPAGGPPAGERPEGGPGGMDGPGGDASGMGDITGGPQDGTTQSNTGSGNSRNYGSYEEMLAAYRADIASIQAGDRYGNNIVELYDPLRYMGDEDTEDPAWSRIVMGACEGDISLFSSLNLQLAWLSAGVDVQLEWQWDGSHVPGEVLGSSFALYVDTMYGEYGGAAVTGAAAPQQTENGGSGEPSGKDISGWVSLEQGKVCFSLADAAAYRTAGASKAMPAFDVIDYGQEDYVFGSAKQDARHWDRYLMEVFEENAAVLAPLFDGSGDK